MPGAVKRTRKPNAMQFSLMKTRSHARPSMSKYVPPTPDQGLKQQLHKCQWITSDCGGFENSIDSQLIRYINCIVYHPLVRYTAFVHQSQPLIP